MILADGTEARASADENPDLFWAIRGGGGNFGVVTSFTFRAHPVSIVQAGPTFWPLEQTAEVMRWWSEFIRHGSARAERLLRDDDGARRPTSCRRSSTSRRSAP